MVITSRVASSLNRDCGIDLVLRANGQQPGAVRLRLNILIETYVLYSCQFGIFIPF